MYKVKIDQVFHVHENDYLSTFNSFPRLYEYYWFIIIAIQVLFAQDYNKIGVHVVISRCRLRLAVQNYTSLVISPSKEVPGALHW